LTGDSCGSRRSLSTLLQEMTWRQIGAKPFLEAMLILDRLQPYEQTSVKYFSKFMHFHWRNNAWKRPSAFRSKMESSIKDYGRKSLKNPSSGHIKHNPHSCSISQYYNQAWDSRFIKNPEEGNFPKFRIFNTPIFC